MHGKLNLKSFKAASFEIALKRYLNVKLVENIDNSQIFRLGFFFLISFRKYKQKYLEIKD